MPRTTLAFALPLLLSLSGCATLFGPGDDTPPAQDDQSQASTDRVIETVTPPQDDREFTPEVLFLLTSAEIAAQRRQFDVTLSNYVEAALQSRDTGVIRRGMLIAESLNSQQAQQILAEVWLDVEPDNHDALRANAIVSLRDGHLERTLGYLQEILNQGGDADFDSLAAMGARLAPDQQQELLQLYKELGARHPDDAEIRYSRALLESLTGAPEPALQTLAPLMSDDQDYQPALVLWGDLLYQTGRKEDALRHLQINTRRYPSNLQMGTLYARMLVNEDRLQEAQDEFGRLVARAPDNHSLRLSHGLVALENGDLDVARSELRQLISRGQHVAEALYYMGQLSEAEGSPDRAIAFYEQVTSGSHYYPAISRATELRAQEGDITTAIARVRELRESNPEDAENLWLIEVNLLLNEGRDEDAIEASGQALEAFPANPRLRYARAMTHERLGNIDRAEADLREMLEQQPDNPTALNALGYILTIHTDRLDEAVALIEAALTLEPDNAAILDSMGWVLFRMGNTEAALNYLEEAYTRSQDPEIAAHYGEVLWVSGNEAQARVVWKDALDADPEHPVLRETLERLSVGEL